jgi:hypothetical protein
MCSNVERGERVALFMPRLQIEHMGAELLRTCRGRISKNMQRQEDQSMHRGQCLVKHQGNNLW